MKKFYLLIVLACSSSVVFSQTLFTYGNMGVDKEEFLRAYNKNKVVVTDKEKSLREYLDLYAKFKLKVKAAKDLHLDTLQQLRFDLQNFRSQVAESYLTNEQELNNLINEAFIRSQKDIHVFHFFTTIDAKMSAADTASAYAGMNELLQKLNSGASDYQEQAKAISEKYKTVKAGDLGFITAFSVPYEYEQIVYALKPGQTSTIYRAKNGIHIFKVLEERKAAGTWKVAQILLSIPPGESAAYSEPLKRKADSICVALKQGADFAKMADLYSDDKLTFMAGGEMPDFGTGKFAVDFEKEIFSLANDGDISKPILSAYGWHIIKRIKQTPTPSDRTDATYRYELKQKVLQDSRINIGKEKFTKEIAAKTGFKKLNTIKEADLFRYADSVAAEKPDATVKKYPISNKVLYAFSKGNTTGSDWLEFVHEYKSNPALYHGETNAELLDKYSSVAVLEYYKKHLEEYSLDFKYQMDEFRDGNILFEIMERNVWGNASNDSVGLLQAFNANRAKYVWGASASVILFNCSNPKTATEAITAMRSGKDWKTVVVEGNNTIQGDSGRYEITQLPLGAGVTAVPGLISTPTVNSMDGTANFIKVLQLFDAGMPRSFDEARGLVISDYQSVLEEKWIDELKKKYPVKVNEAVFQSLLK